MIPLGHLSVKNYSFDSGCMSNLTKNKCIFNFTDVNKNVDIN